MYHASITIKVKINIKFKGTLHEKQPCRILKRRKIIHLDCHVMSLTPSSFCSASAARQCYVPGMLVMTSMNAIEIKLKSI